VPGGNQDAERRGRDARGRRGGPERRRGRRAEPGERQQPRQRLAPPGGSRHPHLRRRSVRHRIPKRRREREPRLADVAQPGLRVALEATLEQAAYASGCRRRQRAPRQRLLDDGREHVGHRLAVEQTPARQHLEQHDAERPDVGALVDRLSARLLGRHVSRAAQDDPGGRAGVGERRRL
jgi:hypothetical protein